ncbi:MAG: FtsX-like permease family protein [Gammaproteobacteria bacterium]|jgi:putative ABC transport system permease protein|nr:FtsX-like permease family protein [Gammaproteobacteria bacterium]
MNLLALAWHSLLNRRFTVVMTVVTIALSIALLVMVEQLRTEVREGFYRSVSGTDLIVGARTAPVQLLLYSVFGLGSPTNNVSWSSYRMVADHRSVAWTIPISLGDSHQGYRVTGTTDAFFEHFRYGDSQALGFREGRAFDDLYDVVVGYQVARKLGYAVGDRIAIAHGGGNVSLHEHDDHPFSISGVLAPTGTPVDQSLYISLAAYEAIHTGWRGGVHRPGSGLAPDEARQQREQLVPEAITATLVGLHTRAAVFGLQRELNDYAPEALTAIMPGITLQQLWRITGVAEQVLRIVAALVVITGLLGMLTVLMTTLNERRREMAILRANGARPWQIAALLVFEAGLITVAGIVLGVLIAVGSLVLAAPWVLDTFGLAVGPSLPEAWQLGVLGLIALAGLLVALVPATMAYRRTLTDGMQVRT